MGLGLAALHALAIRSTYANQQHRYCRHHPGRLCNNRAGGNDAEIVIAQPQRMPMKQRIARPARAVVPEGIRSPHDIQVARNVTAILRGMRHAGVERVAEAAPCETGDAGCER